MKIKNQRNLLAIISFLFLLVTIACGSGSSEPVATSTPRPLTIWDYEVVCQQGVIEQASTYDGATEEVHPVLLFKRDTSDETSYDSLTNTTLELPEPWIVDYEGDATSVELVACITRVSEEFVDTCEYGDDEDPDKVYLLDVYNASYEVKLFAATTGEEIGNTTLDLTYEECPMFHMFSEDKEETFAYIEGGDLQPFLEEFVAP